jgi:hypothetical protein
LTVSLDDIMRHTPSCTTQHTENGKEKKKIENNNNNNKYIEPCITGLLQSRQQKRAAAADIINQWINDYYMPIPKATRTRWRP